MVSLGVNFLPIPAGYSFRLLSMMPSGKGELSHHLSPDHWKPEECPPSDKVLDFFNSYF